MVADAETHGHNHHFVRCHIALTHPETRAGTHHSTWCIEAAKMWPPNLKPGQAHPPTNEANHAKLLRYLRVKGMPRLRQLLYLKTLSNAEIDRYTRPGERTDRAAVAVNTSATRRAHIK